MTNLKRKQVRIYLDESDQARLDSLVNRIGSTLSETTIVTTLLSAALKTCEDEGSRMPLPLAFQFSDPSDSDRNFALNERSKNQKPQQK